MQNKHGYIDMPILEINKISMLRIRIPLRLKTNAIKTNTKTIQDYLLQELIV